MDCRQYATDDAGLWTKEKLANGLRRGKQKRGRNGGGQRPLAKAALGKTTGESKMPKKARNKVWFSALLPSGTQAEGMHATQQELRG